jgi:hypothetical protein
MAPGSIDPSWWADVKDKPWSETYPVIYQKTCLDPVRIMLGGYYAGLNYTIAGSEEDLAAARKILLHLADYSFEFDHYDVGMNYAVWGHYALNAYDSMFGVLFPDGSVPPIGDAYARRIKLADEFTYVHAHKAYRDPRYAWLLKNAEHKRAELLFIGIDTKGGKSAQITSRLYDEHGYAFLRDRADDDYWNSDGWCAFLTFDKSGVHCNQDKLSLMLFGCGKLLIPDVEAKATVPHAFSAKVQRQLNRSALSQNTVMIDSRDQRGIGEVLSVVEFTDSPGEKSVTAADFKGLLYEGVEQSRTIVVTSDYVLDVFQITAETERDIKWIIHTIGTPDAQKSSVELKASDIKLPGAGSWLRDFRSATTDQPIRLEWSEDSVNFAMTMAGAAKTRLITCGYPTSDEPDCPTVPMVLIERRASATVYAAVYQARRQQLGEIQIERLEDANDRLVFQTVGSWGRRKHFVSRLR